MQYKSKTMPNTTIGVAVLLKLKCRGVNLTKKGGVKNRRGAVAPRSRCRRCREGKVLRDGCSHPSRLLGVGSVISSHSGVPGGTLPVNVFWCILSLKKNLITANCIFVKFCETYYIRPTWLTPCKEMGRNVPKCISHSQNYGAVKAPSLSLPSTVSQPHTQRGLRT